VVEIIAICIFCVAALLGWPLWFVFIAGKQKEHVNPDISEAESSRAWAIDMKEKYTCKRPRKKEEP
jgi:hypothetical protein